LGLAQQTTEEIQKMAQISARDKNSSDFISKILNVESLQRIPDYILPCDNALAVTVTIAGHEATGYGEGGYELAYGKALSEATERCLLRWFNEQSGIKVTSNGWACHISSQLAIRSAIFELIERDVALKTWFRAAPYFIIPDDLLPKNVLKWKEPRDHQLEFHDLKIAISTGENGACVSAFLFNESANFVVGHASRWDLDQAINSAVAECLRAACSAIRFEHYAEVLALHRGDPNRRFQPGSHSLAYAYTNSLPSEISLKPSSSFEILAKWREHQQAFERIDQKSLSISTFEVGDRVVARVTGREFLEMFWGPTSRAQLDQMNGNNIFPHCVG
jgi:hypothetical protein